MILGSFIFGSLLFQFLESLCFVHVFLIFSTRFHHVLRCFTEAKNGSLILLYLLVCRGNGDDNGSGRLSRRLSRLSSRYQSREPPRPPAQPERLPALPDRPVQQGACVCVCARWCSSNSFQSENKTIELIFNVFQCSCTGRQTLHPDSGSSCPTHVFATQEPRESPKTQTSPSAAV